MKCIFPILPLLILAGWGRPAGAQLAEAPRFNGATTSAPAAAPARATTAPARTAITQAPPAQRLAARSDSPATAPNAAPPAAAAPATANPATGQGGGAPPSAAVLGAPVAGGSAANAGTRAKETLLRAMALQAQRQSVAARIRTEVQLYGQHLAGSGTYVQGPAKPGTWRLELRMQTDDGSTSLVQVCDGAQLWTYRQAADRPLLERVDAGIVAAALARHEKERSTGGAPPQVPVGLGLGYGGLPRLLRMLSECFDYRAINEGRLEGMPVWILEGTWTPELLAVLLPEQKGAIEAGQGVRLSKLPTHIPDRVTLYLGRDDLFPYRLEYHRDHLGEKEWELAERANPPHSIVKLEWFEVRFDLPLARDQFAFDPGDTKYEDATKRYLESLGLPAP